MVSHSEQSTGIQKIETYEIFENPAGFFSNTFSHFQNQTFLNGIWER